MAKCSSSVSCFANADVLVQGKSMMSHGFLIQTATFTTLLEYELVLVEKENDYLVRPLAVTKVIYCSHPGVLIVELFELGGKNQKHDLQFSSLIIQSLGFTVRASGTLLVSA